ncbi:hypothetical protein M3194_14450 [Paenibacillus glycanilyticus]|uniref:hypothetical protein n=1 Tax=Paenibacillus glycanilyticus TaxID=126569 RepID=UPI0020405979|nr:hypothetical protein [Paenibacillus glycanilyticus]MCM3628562.1 hypothetical protein [Paenibacillus glycanilyticus]
MRKSYLIVIILFIMAVMVLARHNENGFRITVHNKLDQSIPELVMTFPHGTKTFRMEADSVRTIHVDPKNFGEGSINLIYEGEQGQQEIMVIGYIEEGYEGKADVSIDSVSEQGELQVKVQQDVNLY